MLKPVHGAKRKTSRSAAQGQHGNNQGHHGWTLMVIFGPSHKTHGPLVPLAHFKVAGGQSQLSVASLH